MKSTIKEKMITIKRAINVDSETRDFIFRNCNYRRNVWNDFVEEWHSCKEENRSFNPTLYATEYFAIHGPESESGFCTGIREQVSKDIKKALKVVRRNGGDLYFHKFNPHRASFRVHCKPQYGIKNKWGGRPFNSRLYILDEYTLFFREDAKNYHEIHLREAITSKFLKEFHVSKNEDYIFRPEDIKAICFLHELGRFYVSIEVLVKYIVPKAKKNPKKKAGIDLGIHNPICLYDGKSIRNIRMSQKELNKIYYLEKRIRKLQRIMDKKEYYSKNYEKVRRKFRRSFKKMRDVRLNWRREVANELSKEFDIICLDTFHQPKRSEQGDLPRKTLRSINYTNRIHAMSYVAPFLEHKMEKCGKTFIKAPEKTTCFCSVCGFENPPLPLGFRTFHCFSCGHVEDRDANASKNCYTAIV